MLSTTFLFSLDNTIVSQSDLPLPFLCYWLWTQVADLQPSILYSFDEVWPFPWIGTGFALGTMAILPRGKPYGVFNTKTTYVFNILLFEVGGALCGASPNMIALIIGRVIAGVGGSGIYSGTLTYVSVSTTMKEEAAYLSGVPLCGVLEVCWTKWYLLMGFGSASCSEWLTSNRSAELLPVVELPGDGFVIASL